MTGWPKGSALTAGDKLNLTCEAATKGGVPDSFKWYKGVTKMNSTGTKGERYHVMSVATTDAGDYRCKAINADGTAESVSQTLRIGGKLIKSTKCDGIRTPFTRRRSVLLGSLATHYMRRVARYWPPYC